MIDLGLSDFEFDELIEVLSTPHTYKVTAELHDRSGNTKQTLTPYLHEDTGQVDVDEDFRTGRMLNLNLWDPYGDVQLDGASYLSRTVAVDFKVPIPSLEVPVTIPVGRFPIVAVDPEGPLIRITGAGRALLCQGALLQEHTFLKGHLVTNAITTALHDWAGLPLSNLELPTLTATLPEDFTTDFGDDPWKIAGILAASIGYIRFMDGAGQVQMREHQTTPCFDFDKRTVTSFPTMSQTLTDSDGQPLPNVVRVNGFDGPPPIRVTRYADPRSPISREKLAVFGVDWERLTTVDNPHIREVATAERIGDAVLARAEQTAVQYNFEAVPIPLFDEGDCVSVNAFGVAAVFAMSQFTIPLSASGSMTVGKKRQLSYAGATARWA